MNLSKKALGVKPSMTLKIGAMAKKMKAEGRDVIGFGAGEPDFGTPNYIKEAAKQALDSEMTKYTPASGTLELKSAVADRLKNMYGLEYAPSDIVISNGAKHSLFNVFAAILNPGDEVIIPVPFWVSYPELVKMNDGVPVFVQGDETFKVSAGDIKAAITDKTKALILNTPSNPCGAVYSKSELEDIAKVVVEAGIFVVSDEIYDELIYDGKHESIATLGADIKALTILVNGMSKTYAMTGWRIGYTASVGEIAKIMGAFQSHGASNPNSIAQHASVVALSGPQDDVAVMKVKFAKRRTMLCDLINGVEGLSCSVPKGAFYVMMDISKQFGKSYDGAPINDSLEFSEVLLKNTLTAVVPGVAFGADNFVRMSYATSEQNIEKGMERIKEFVGLLK